MKDPTRRINKQATDWETIFGNHQFHKGIVYSIYKKKYKKLRIKKSQKTAEDVNRHFTEDIQMANEHMERYSTSLARRKLQIKTIMEYHYTYIRMVKIKTGDLKF